jgi:AcrR family transcriptional regulator
MTRKFQKGQTTRRHLVETATRLFAKAGYEATSTEHVLAAADVSRGALYHHFDSKETLFEAVLEAMEAEIAQSIRAAARGHADPVDALRAGCDAWLRLAREPAVRQIVLIDAPSVVGWQKWREIDERYGLGLMKASLHAAANAGRVRKELADVFAYMLLAALNEIALIVARADDAGPALRKGRAAAKELLDKLFGE